MQACSQGSRSGRTTLSRAIILNIVVSLYAATGNSQFLNPKKGPKAEENDPPPVIRRHGYGPEMCYDWN